MRRWIAETVKLWLLGLGVAFLAVLISLACVGDWVGLAAAALIFLGAAIVASDG